MKKMNAFERERERGNLGLFQVKEVNLRGFGLSNIVGLSRCLRRCLRLDALAALARLIAHHNHPAAPGDRTSSIAAVRAAPGVAHFRHW